MYGIMCFMRGVWYVVRLCCVNEVRRVCGACNGSCVCVICVWFVCCVCVMCVMRVVCVSLCHVVCDVCMVCVVLFVCDVSVWYL